MSGYQMETRRAYDNYRVEVIPEKVYFRSDRRTEHEYRVMELREAKESIERHVDAHGEVTALWDAKDVCVHCNISAEDAMTDDGPGCCDEAVAHYDAWKAQRFTGPGYEAHPGHDHEDCCK